MFTWTPIYKELARKLLDYRDRQPELIRMIIDLSDQGIPVIGLKDKDGISAEVKLQFHKSFQLSFPYLGEQ